MADTEREALLQKALTAEVGGRFRHMNAYMRELVEMNVALSKEERQTLSVGYNKALSECIGTARKVKELVAQCKESADPVHVESGRSLMTLWRQLLREVRNICSEISVLIASHLLPSTASIDSEVFYKKWQGDLLRVAAAHCEDGDPQRRHFVAGAELAYHNALEQANLELQPTDLTRLCLSLQHATFTAEVLQDPQAAVDLANKAIEEAAAEWPATTGFGKAHISNYKETVTVLHLLHRNAQYWTAQLDAERTPEGTPTPGNLDSGILDDFELGLDGPDEPYEAVGRPPLVSGYATIKATLQESRRRAQRTRSSKT